MFTSPIPVWVYIVAGLLIFGSGAASGTLVTVRIYAAAHERALEKQKADLEAAKLAEYKRAVADTEARLAANTKADTAKPRVKTIVKPGVCEIPAEAMRALNDAELVGETE